MSRDVNELIGVCKGLLADGVVNLQEAEFLLGWLEAHRSVTEFWPGNVLYETMNEILEDGQISHEQESEMLGVSIEITGHPIVVEVVDERAPARATVKTLNTSCSLPLHEPENGIQFAGKNFVFTGKFLCGSRSECAQQALKRGGNIQKSVTQTTDHLVVGEVGSEAWAQSSYGRKIEKAVFMREHGHEIFIIREATWREAANI